ncbi:MAG: hypothetical protein GXY33_18315 [Phycisphaerae bacterium]|nr:hypothetical protein [Phycisphaerae bacterium]
MPIEFQCDMCGKRLRDSDPDRYIVRTEVFASADRNILNVASGSSLQGELTALLEELRRANPDELEDQTYRNFRFDLCRNCHRQYLTGPLPNAEPEPRT